MTTDTAATLADRREHWQRLPAEQRIRRVHNAVLRTVEIARWRRMARQQRTNDFLFPERSRK